MKFYIEESKEITQKEIEEVKNSIGNNYTDEEIKNIICIADKLINFIFDIEHHEE